MLIILLLAIWSFGSAANAVSDIEQNELLVTDLRIEYFTNPLGIDDTHPCLSWKLNSDQRNTSQTVYQIQVSETSGFEEDRLHRTVFF